MIEFKKLRKVYKSRKGGKCVALKDIDLKLPDTGLVFIIGKSGSGKSTMLNLLGGLDTITSGDIIADGNSLSSFKKRDFENYRNSYIGFVFQHYYLLEELTVVQNVELAMGISGSDDRKRAEELLARVGLKGCEDRYPRELSGGQQQRVAIARALAKDPKLVLGDELTGNLDHNTSVDILNVLKEISKEKLVVVVSHNLDEADMFADRIIELHDGQISRDRSRITRNQQKFSIKGHVAYLPYFRDLTQNEVKTLEAGLHSGQIRDIVQRDDGFVMSTEPKTSDRRVYLPRRSFVRKKRSQYTGIFTRKGLLSKAVAVLITTLMILCVSVFSSMHKIGYNEVPYDKEDNYLSLVKSGLENDGAGIFSAPFYRILDSEIKQAEEISGEKIYELINVTVTTADGVSSTTAGGAQADMRRNFRGFYVLETYGTLICDEQFLIDEYGVDGELVYLAGDPYKFESVNDASTRGRTIITDYVADAMIKFRSDRFKSYEDIVNNETAIAIIKTDYKEKYAEIIKAYDEYTGTDGYESLYYELCRENPLFEEYLEEVIYSLGITYTFDQDFAKKIIENPSRSNATLRNVAFDQGGGRKNPISGVTISHSSSYGLKQGQIQMDYSTYNSFFGTGYTLSNYKTEFEPHAVTMRVYDRSGEGAELLCEQEFEIVGLVEYGGVRTYKDDFYSVREYTLQTFGIYVKNNENLDKVVSTMSEDVIAPRSIAFDAIAGINKILTVFVPLFKLIAGGLYIFIIIYLINHAMQTIKKNYFQIGVLRSFGAKNTDVGMIFITGVMLVGLAISVLSVVFEPLIVEIYNTILVESFALVINTYAFDVRIINMPSWLPIVNAVGVLVITVASALAALLVVRNLKPIEIIRAKDNGGEVS